MPLHKRFSWPLRELKHKKKLAIARRQQDASGLAEKTHLSEERRWREGEVIIHAGLVSKEDFTSDANVYRSSIYDTDIPRRRRK